MFFRLRLHRVKIAASSTSRPVIADQVAAMRDPFSWSTQMGALNTRAHLDRVKQYVESGLSEGARLVAGGERPAGAGRW